MIEGFARHEIAMVSSLKGMIVCEYDYPSRCPITDHSTAQLEAVYGPGHPPCTKYDVMILKQGHKYYARGIWYPGFPEANQYNPNWVMLDVGFSVLGILEAVEDLWNEIQKHSR